jgi:heme/copper-type cytochrome/quinol oxidase subunit 2
MEIWSLFCKTIDSDGTMPITHGLFFGQCRLGWEEHHQHSPLSKYSRHLGSGIWNIIISTCRIIIIITIIIMIMIIIIIIKTNTYNPRLMHSNDLGYCNLWSIYPSFVSQTQAKFAELI